MMDSASYDYAEAYAHSAPACMRESDSGGLYLSEQRPPDRDSRQRKAHPCEPAGQGSRDQETAPQRAHGCTPHSHECTPCLPQGCYPHPQGYALYPQGCNPYPQGCALYPQECNPHPQGCDPYLPQCAYASFARPYPPYRFAPPPYFAGAPHLCAAPTAQAIKPQRGLTSQIIRLILVLILVCVLVMAFNHAVSGWRQNNAVLPPPPQDVTPS
jgi:hypothetical protein